MTYKQCKERINYFIEESKFLLFNRTVKCLKNIEKN